MNRLRKKGLEPVTTVALSLGLLGVVLAAYFYWTGDIGGRGFAATRHSGLGNSLNNCREFGNSRERDYDDSDEDGLPDFCDNCPNTPNIEKEDKNSLFISFENDEDGDLFPVGCEGNDGSDPPGTCGRKETTKLDENPRRHPCYKWKGGLPEEKP